MPTFETPEPISVTIDLPVGEARIVASDRADTVVEIRPGDGGDESAVAATRVEMVNRQLLIKGAALRGWGAKWGLGFLGLGWSGAAAEVEIALPSGSRVHGETSFGGFQAEGRLGECRLRTDYGDIRLGHTGSVDLRTSSGEIVVDRVDGHAEISTSSGDIRVRDVDGTAVISNEHGEIHVGHITGDLRLSGSHGDMDVDRAAAGVEARTAYGNVRIGQVTRGVTTLTTTSGELEVGVRHGTAAWLDVSSSTGELHNHLEARDDPDGFAETVEIHARTRDGDIVLRRA
ncbi:DUF4097 family beta strand repeat-containing protein [Pseudonocardia aurantiaca]|uniref:DUF4097 domain-containing protein n=1 Tax=Pseudonocardia aurantiaca TaxID=75290 RepID=A0ABW4FPQ3_9PSEU